MKCCWRLEKDLTKRWQFPHKAAEMVREPPTLMDAVALAAGLEDITSSQTVDKNCRIHGVGHSDEDCLKQKGTAKGKDKKDEGSSSKLEGIAKLDKKQTQRNVKDHIQCFRCKKQGHYANKCPERQAHEVQMVELGSELEEFMLEEDTNSPFLVPVTLFGKNDVRKSVSALVDTGASVSVIARSIQEQLGLTVTPRDGQVIGATGGRARLGYTTVSMGVGGKQLERNVEVMEIDRYLFIVGRDLLSEFGISLHGLPSSKNEATSMRTTPHVEEHEEVGIALHSRASEVSKGIQSALVKNYQLGDGFCTAPCAVMTIPTGNALPSYVRQYLVPEAVHERVTVKVDDLLKRGIIRKVKDPETGKDVERLLGVANYLRDYIPLYSRIAAPLEKLRKMKRLGDSWTKECRLALRLLLDNAITLQPVVNFLLSYSL